MHNWKDIIQLIGKARRILLLTHANMDGDAAGSVCALCRSLRLMGKECFALLEDGCPSYLAFLNADGYFVSEAPWQADLAIAVDCGDDSRIEKRCEAFHGAAATACIDHHPAHAEFAGESVVDPLAPAAGSLVFELLQEGDFPIDKEIAEALYVAIATDTGSFKHGNTTAGAHLDAAKLYGFGIDAARLNALVYGNFPLAQLKLEALAVERAVLFAGGKAALSWCAQEDLKSLGAKDEHTDMCIDRIRSIEGVEAAAFFKERADGSIKVSLRSKLKADVNAVARQFDGGGHLRASGCTLKDVSMEEAIEMVKPAIEACVREDAT
ncbi:MAG: bifunctional oligoribonuclease/PAP phosphatase NrnA [Clostridia bacterium]|nr:bifunctional oligoribonuclease/PAP phosphatase NrnA [Clostridia bacterium]